MGEVSALPALRSVTLRLLQAAPGTPALKQLPAPQDTIFTKKSGPVVTFPLFAVSAASNGHIHATCLWSKFPEEGILFFCFFFF